MIITPKRISSAVEGLFCSQEKKLLSSISKELKFPINIERTKTGVFDKWLVGIDDTGKFIATTGSRIPSGDFATISRTGMLQNGIYSKVVKADVGKNIHDFFRNLSEQMGLKFDFNRTKAGKIGNRLYCEDYTNGNFIAATREVLSNGDFGVVARHGIVENSASKVISKTSLA